MCRWYARDPEAHSGTAERTAECGAIATWPPEVYSGAAGTLECVAGESAPLKPCFPTIPSPLRRGLFRQIQNACGHPEALPTVLFASFGFLLEIGRTDFEVSP